MFLYINYPSWIHPQIFPGIKFLGLLRWYGLMYAFAFATAYFLLRKVWKEGALDSGNAKASEDDVFSFIFTGIVFLLIGARVFSTLIYDTSGFYRHKPWLIFWPFDAAGKFTGLTGMSYHGGFVGGLIGMIVWCKFKKRPVAKWVNHKMDRCNGLLYSAWLYLWPSGKFLKRRALWSYYHNAMGNDFSGCRALFFKAALGSGIRR